MKRGVWPDRTTVWRWHFYAGLLCIPFVLWLAATGSIYLFKPQIDALHDRPYSSLSVHGAPAPPSVQITAALAAVPSSTFSQYVVPASERSAVQVLVIRGSKLTRIYVHPETLQILNVADEDSLLTRQIFHLHGELMAGDRGSMIVETAASWAIVMLITGLYLWWPRGATGIAGVVYPRLQQDGRLFWRDLHAVTGFWVSFFALFLLISGLPWSKSWGGLLKDVRRWSVSAPVNQDWTTGRSSELAQRRLNADAIDGHAEHHHAGGHTPVSLQAIDGLLPIVRSANLAPPVLILPPSARNGSWTAKSDSQNRPLRSELTLDAEHATITARQDFSQRPLFDRILGVGIAAHEGQLFAPLNQLLGLFTAISLWTVCISAIFMWWRRRPAGTLGPPARVEGSRVSVAMITLIVLLGVLLPLLGATLLIVLAVEWTLLRRWPAARDFLGLRRTPANASH